MASEDHNILRREVKRSTKPRPHPARNLAHSGSVHRRKGFHQPSQIHAPVCCVHDSIPSSGHPPVRNSCRRVLPSLPNGAFLLEPIQIDRGQTVGGALPFTFGKMTCQMKLRLVWILLLPLAAVAMGNPNSLRSGKIRLHLRPALSLSMTMDLRPRHASMSGSVRLIRPSLSRICGTDTGAAAPLVVWPRSRCAWSR